MKSYIEMKIVNAILFFLLLLVGSGQVKAEKMPSNSTYKVEIEDGNGWKTLYSHNAKVFWGTNNMSFVKFTNAFTSDVKVKVTKNTGPFDKVEIRPFSNQIKHQKLSDNVIEFTMKKAQKVSVEFDGDRYNNLFVFADKPELSTPDKSDPNVIWYGPGIHHVGQIILQSNQTLYLHEDALVYGYIESIGSQNIRICGRGIIDSSDENMDTSKPRVSQLLLANCSDVVVEDILMRNTPTWNVSMFACDNVHINGIKQIGSNANSDGLDICNSSNVLIENTFQRNKDDNISIKVFDKESIRDTDGGGSADLDSLNVENSFNITMRNCVLWADEAHNMLVGPEARGGKFYNIRFENIDVLENTQNDETYPGVMAIMIADQGEYSDISWDNIRVEDITKGKVISISYQNAYAPLGYGRFAKNIKFSNISYIGGRASKSRIIGLNNTQNVDGVTITNYRINGVEATDLATANMITNPYAKNISVVAGVSPNPGSILPSMLDDNLEVKVNETKQLSYAQFAHNFVYVDPLGTIKITQLPTNGSLLIDNQPVAVGAILSYLQMDKLTYKPNQDFGGTDELIWQGTCDGISSTNTAKIIFSVFKTKVIGVSISDNFVPSTALTDFHEVSSNLNVDTSNPSLLDGKVARIKRTTDTEEYVVVKQNSDITFFDVLFFGYHSAEGLLKCYTSVDGREWTYIPTNTGNGTETTPGSGWFRKHLIPVVPIAADHQFLKIVFNISTIEWGTQLSEIKVGKMSAYCEADIHTPLSKTSHPTQALLHVVGQEPISTPINWAESTPAFNADKKGVYVFSKNLVLPDAYTSLSRSLQVTSTVSITDIWADLLYLHGKDDFMARDGDGDIIYTDGAKVPNLITDIEDGKQVKIGEQKYYEMGNCYLNNVPGWKIKPELFQDRYVAVSRSAQADAFITYAVNSEYNFETEFMSLTGTNNVSTSISLEMSADNKTWKKAQYKLEDLKTVSAGGVFSLYKACLDYIPKSIRFVRISMKNGLANLPTWAPQILSVSSNPVQPIIPITNENISFMGRIDRSSTQYARLFWSGSSLTVKFNGTELAAVVGAERGKLAIFIDGVKQPLQLLDGISEKQLAKGLSSGEHTIKIVRASLVEDGPIDIYGFATDGELVPVTDMPEMKIEFFGNSVSEGASAGALSTADRDNRAYDDHTMAYSYLVAKKLDAEYNNTSIAGIAVSDGAGWLPFGMQSRFNLLDPYNTTSVWDLSEYKPSICVMALGINDAYKPEGILSAKWRENYLKIITELIEAYGNETKFVFATPPMISADADVIEWTKNLVKSLQLGGFNAYHYIYTHPRIEGHPIASEHIVIADELYNYIKFYVLGTTPIQQTNKEEEIALSYNSALHKLSIISDRKDLTPVYIYNLTGQIVRQYRMNTSIDIDTSELTHGLYIVNIGGYKKKILIY